MKSPEHIHQLIMVARESSQMTVGEQKEFPLKRKLSRAEVEWLTTEVNAGKRDFKIFFDRKAHTLVAQCRSILEGEPN